MRLSLVHGLGIDVRDADGCASRGKQLGRRQADAAGTASDCEDLSKERHVQSCASVMCREADELSITRPRRSGFYPGAD